MEAYLSCVTFGAADLDQESYSFVVVGSFPEVAALGCNVSPVYVRLTLGNCK